MKLPASNILFELDPSRPVPAHEPAVGSLPAKMLSPSSKRLAPLLCAATLLLSSFGILANGLFNTIYTFPTGGQNGVGPQATLVQGTDGYFYGTTTYGGIYSKGTVFKTTVSGALARLYSFTGGVDGANPAAGLVQASDGYFYGTSYGNDFSTGSAGPYGSVFKISATGKFTTLFTFTYGPAGVNPSAGLVQGTDGYFYGTTCHGGSNYFGTIFKIDTNGMYTNLYSFTNGVDGANPLAGLVQGTDGFFYGTASEGGLDQYGTVFKISSNGVFSSLHSFNGYRDGSNPHAGLVLGSDSNFYGSTYTSPIVQTPNGNFNGTVFKITTDGYFTTLYLFYNNDGGACPSAALVQGSDGNFYGTTSLGGVFPLNWGTIFKITPMGVLNYVYSFTNGIDDWSPVAGLVQGTNGSFYGSATGGAGTLFQLNVFSPPWITTQPLSVSATNGTLASFTVLAAGPGPLRYQWQLNGTNLPNGTGISDNVIDTLSLTAAEADAGGYSVIVANAYGAVTSRVATLTVLGTGPPSPITLQAAPLPTNTWSIDFPTVSGQTYTVQQNADLSTTNWIFYTNLTGNGSTAQFAVPITDAASRFFRVLLPY